MENEKYLAQETEKKTPPEKQKFRFDRAELALLIMALGVAYLFIKLLWNGNAGTSIVLFVASIYITTCIYCKLAGLRMNWTVESIILICLVLALSLPFVLFDMSAGRTLATFAALMCIIAMQLYTLLGARRYRFTQKEYIEDWTDAIFVMPFANLGSSWLTLGNAGKEGRAKGILLGILGFIVAIPLCAILLNLMNEADVVFANMLEKINAYFADAIIEEIRNLFKSIFFAMMAFGILYGLRYKNGLQKSKSIDTEKTRRIPASAACGLLFPAALIYCAYLISQLAYFTSAFAGLLPKNYTYAEYARQGFFELCAMCIINLTIVVVLLSFVKAGKWFRNVFATFFSLVSLFLTATAMAKMVLYMQNYGLTPERLHTTLFMFFIGCVFLYILARLYWNRFPIAQTLFITAAAFLLVFAYVDAEALSLRYNMNAIESAQLKDSAYFAGFSEMQLTYMSDGIESVLQSYADNEKYSEHALKLLSERKKLRREGLLTSVSWWNWNLQTWTAER